MTETDKANLKKLTPEVLIERFVLEAKLSEPGVCDAREMNAHGERADRYLAEIGLRGGLRSLAPLLDSAERWVAYKTARALVRTDETAANALATLDRIAEERSGSASAAANMARNILRYGDPLGDPAAVEGRLASIRARDAER